MQKLPFLLLHQANASSILTLTPPLSSRKLPASALSGTLLAFYGNVQLPSSSSCAVSFIFITSSSNLFFSFLFYQENSPYSSLLLSSHHHHQLSLSFSTLGPLVSPSFSSPFASVPITICSVLVAVTSPFISHLVEVVF